MPWIEKEKCSGCGVCISSCSVGAIALGSDRKAEINNSLCTKCGNCFSSCPLGAIRSNSESASLRGGGVGNPFSATSHNRGLGMGGGRGKGRRGMSGR
ncbi:MAG: 4Fe-4S binding protein [bacterium]